MDIACKCLACAVCVRRCTLGFCKDAIPRVRFVGGARQDMCPKSSSTRGASRGDVHPLLRQVRTIIERSVDTPDERTIGNGITAAGCSIRLRTHIAPESVDLSECRRARRGGSLWRMAWHDPTATIGCVVWGLQQAHGGRPGIRFIRVARSQEMCRRKRRGGRRHGRRSVQGGH